MGLFDVANELLDVRFAFLDILPYLSKFTNTVHAFFNEFWDTETTQI